eukprot:GHVT01041729.1.p1 GENE.GHVT01041729.1~~GHVT01041729.1.p1  ORF type:complete len:350 (-),score=102.02 GHVT01041729.1:1547-2596(-)
MTIPTVSEQENLDDRHVPQSTPSSSSASPTSDDLGRDEASLPELSDKASNLEAPEPSSAPPSDDWSAANLTDEPRDAPLAAANSAPDEADPVETTAEDGALEAEANGAGGEDSGDEEDSEAEDEPPVFLKTEELAPFSTDPTPKETAKSTSSTTSPDSEVSSPKEQVPSTQDPQSPTDAVEDLKPEQEKATEIASIPKQEQEKPSETVAATKGPQFVSKRKRTSKRPKRATRTQTKGAGKKKPKINKLVVASALLGSLPLLLGLGGVAAWGAGAFEPEEEATEEGADDEPAAADEPAPEEAAAADETLAGPGRRLRGRRALAPPMSDVPSGWRRTNLATLLAGGGTCLD